MGSLVEEFQVIGCNLETDFLLFSWLQSHLSEVLQLLLRTDNAALVIAYIELHNLFTGYASTVLYFQRNGQCAIDIHHLSGSHRLRVAV